MQTLLLAAVLISIALILLVSYNSVISIAPSETKAIYVLGQFKGTLSEGYHIVYPFITKSKSVNTKVREIEIPRQTILSSDNKRVTISVTVYLRVSKVETFVQTVDNLEDKMLTIGKSQIKTIISDYESASILSRRQDIMDKIDSKVSDAVESWGVEVERVEISDINVED